MQKELRNTEDKVSYARQFYNDSVTKYNIKIEVIPSNIIASLFGFKAEPLFNVENAEVRKGVKVNFKN